MGLSPLTEAELRLVSAAAAGQVWTPQGDAALRAGVIRSLALGEVLPGATGPSPVHAKGIRIDGAKIGGELDFESASVPVPLWFMDCDFSQPLQIRLAHVVLLSLRGCAVPSIHAHRLHCEGPLHLSRSDVRPFVCPGRIDLTGAKLAAEVSVMGARLGGAAPVALDANGARIGASLNLRDLEARGLIDLTRIDVEGNLHAQGASLLTIGNSAVSIVCRGARIGGDVSVRGGFSAAGLVDFSRAEIKGSLLADGARLEAPQGTALSINQARIGAALGLSQEGAPKGGATLRGHLDVRGARVAELRDDGSLWPDKRTGFLKIDGFQYERFGGRATIVSGRARVRWLKLQRPSDLGRDFKAQPWEHLIRTLNDTGHVNAARYVAIAKEQALHASGSLTWSQYVWSWFSGLLTGYGYLPMRSVYASVLVCLLGVLIFASAERQGIMAPADPNVLLSQAYRERGELPPDYPRLNVWLYSIDVYLPVVDLHQESRWLPARDRDDAARAALNGGAVSKRVLWLRLQASIDRLVTRDVAQAWHWIQILAGWLLASLAIAGFSGLLRPGRD